MKRYSPNRINVDPFAMAFALLADNRDDIDETDYDYIEGSIRSRSVSNLSSLFRSRSPGQRNTAEARLLLQIQALFKKNSDFGDEATRRSNTWKTFCEAEELCSRTNAKYDEFILDSDAIPLEYASKLRHMKYIIDEVLGDVRTCMNLIPEGVRVTSGASSTMTRTVSLPYRKIATRSGHCYPGTRPYAEVLGSMWNFEPRVKVTNFNRVVMVPKQWDKHRLIAAEATWSLPFQLAIDVYLRRRLARVGIDLSDQTRNQRAAKEGSLDGNLCTIDLSSASDTIARSLVEFLLPAEWFQFLSAFRAPFWRHESETGIYAKFSSMGNGFTFSLETLLFYACTKACGAGRPLVYGDDIIVEKDVYENVMDLLSYCGFIPNVDKSFSTGSFRESCGADYHNGINIRAFYLKSNTLDKAEVSNMINRFGVYRIGPRLGKILMDLVKKMQIPLVPTNTDTTSGVWVTSGYERRVSKTYSLEYKALLPRSPRKTTLHHKARYHEWLFRTRNRKSIGEALETSSSSVKDQPGYGCRWRDLITRPHAPETYLWTAMLPCK